MDRVQQQPPDLKAYADRLEHLCRAQADEIGRLRQEVENLRASGSAHTALRSVYNDPQASETNKVRAASAAIGYEQGKIGSVLPSLGNVSRTERWRVYEMWSQRRQYIIEHRAIPPAGWDDHLRPETYQEPEGTEMPPVDVLDTPQGFKVLSNLLPKPGSQRKLGNGGGTSGGDTSS
jgi:hypothetical protein